MSHTAQTGLDSAQNDRCLLISLTDQIAVDHAGVIRAFSHLTAWCVGISLSASLGNGIMIDHGIHISGRDEESKTRLSKDSDAL